MMTLICSGSLLTRLSAQITATAGAHWLTIAANELAFVHAGSHFITVDSRYLQLTVLVQILKIGANESL